MPPNMGGMPPNMGGMPPNMGGMPTNMGGMSNSRPVPQQNRGMRGPSGVDDILSGLNQNDISSNSSRESLGDIRNIEVSSNMRKKKNKKNEGITLDL